MSASEATKLRLRHARAVTRLEQARAHELHAIATTRPTQQQMVALYSAVRDALDILNDLPKEYWRAEPPRYQAMVRVDDLGKDPFR